MPVSQWHKLYTAQVTAPPGVLFELLADMPGYGRWLPGSQQFAHTTDVEPYPVQLGSRYHDGKPDEPGKDWWGTVTGFQPPGSLDFQHTIAVPQLRSTVDVHIHYSLEPDNAGTMVHRWLVLDISMPVVARPLRRLITGSFDKENLRTMSALKAYAETHTGDVPKRLFTARTGKVADCGSYDAEVSVRDRQVVLAGDLAVRAQTEDRRCPAHRRWRFRRHVRLLHDCHAADQYHRSSHHAELPLVDGIRRAWIDGR